jgi:prepilin-type N-terminal cleavage/methylation domain-containing protein
MTMFRGTQNKSPTRPGTHRGFTLIEVVLAVVIVVGMMVVVLFFYQQAADLRVQLVREAERVAAVRLVMDRLSTELRSAHAHPALGAGFRGATDSIEFVRTDFPPRSAWRAGSLGRVEAAQTDLKRVQYARGTTLDGTNVIGTGLVRTESPVVEARQVVNTRAGAVVPEVEEVASPEPLTTEIQTVQFRYWDGRQWAASWSGSTLPKSVEVTLGFEPPVEDTGTNASPAEVFRRIIYLPGGGSGSNGTSGGTNSVDGNEDFFGLPPESPPPGGAL